MTSWHSAHFQDFWGKTDSILRNFVKSVALYHEYIIRAEISQYCRFSKVFWQKWLHGKIANFETFVDLNSRNVESTWSTKLKFWTYAIIPPTLGPDRYIPYYRGWKLFKPPSYSFEWIVKIITVMKIVHYRISMGSEILQASPNKFYQFSPIQTSNIAVLLSIKIKVIR